MKHDILSNDEQRLCVLDSTCYATIADALANFTTDIGNFDPQVPMDYGAAVGFQCGPGQVFLLNATFNASEVMYQCQERVFNTSFQNVTLPECICTS